MNKNKTVHNFDSTLTGANIKRSVFNRTTQHKTTFNTGQLIPILVDEILPGDMFKMNTSYAIRQSSLLAPVMDNSYIDIYYFFVPNRLVWNNWKAFMGENTKGSWYDQTKYTIPTIEAPDEGFESGSLADYMGVPIKVKKINVNALPFRAYSLIYNEWFRDQNIQDPIMIDKGDSDQRAKKMTGNWITEASLGGTPAKVAKYGDYFTSCLPAPQKGQPITLPIGTEAKLMNGSKEYNLFAQLDPITTGAEAITLQEITYVSNDNIKTTGKTIQAERADLAINTNIYADLANATSANINDIRFAFQLQKMYERDARGGSRYTELIQSHFGVISSDARQQRPEYLGGLHQPINVNQVLQTTPGGSDQTPLATTAAYSLTGGSENHFTKSFTEHGYLIGLATVRTEHTYQQGLEKMWSRRERTDYYWPVFANIGEQPVFKKEIMATGTKEDEEVFGYQEAWADYRFKPSRTSGMFRSTNSQPLDYWHYGDKYDKVPTLSSEWLVETTANVDRTLTVQSKVVNQYIADFLFQNKCTRAMPLYSVPGEVDRN